MACAVTPVYGDEKQKIERFGRADIVKIYWLFLIPAIVCALFADKIDKAVNANKKLKKVIMAALIVIAVVIGVILHGVLVIQ